jgi:hypothetical protein
MALALNVFQTVTSVVSLTPSEVYTAPVGYTGVVLLAQVANIGATSEDVTFVHRRSSTDTEILKDYPISSKDTANLLAGKLVLESGDKLVLSGSDASNLKFIASILETLN